MNKDEIDQQTIILFDGVCNLCNGSIDFILRWEKDSIFQFAAIQSEAGHDLLACYGLPPGYREAVILLDRGKTSLGSTAALKIGQYLRFPWSLLSSVGFIIPRLARDWVYTQIAKHRYQWFGKTDACRIPSEELKRRFL